MTNMDQKDLNFSTEALLEALLQIQRLHANESTAEASNMPTPSNQNSLITEVEQVGTNEKSSNEQTEKNEKKPKTKKENLFQLFIEDKNISWLPEFDKQKNVFVQSSSAPTKNFVRYDNKINAKRYETEEVTSTIKHSIPRQSKKSKYARKYNQHFYENLKKDSQEVKKLEFSIEINDEFDEPIRVFDFDSLEKLFVTNEQTVPEDLGWNGKLFRYNRIMDKIHPKAPVDLKAETATKTEGIDLGFGPENKFAEPIMLAGKANVVITDNVLAMIMTSTKSTVGWDVIVEKRNNQLHFFTRKEFELKNKMNEIDKKFARDVLDYRKMIDLDAVNKSQDSELFQAMEISGKKSKTKPAYRYRLFTPCEDLKVLVRCEIDSYIITPGEQKICLVGLRALTEAVPYSAATSWRAKLEIQKGSVLVDEVQKDEIRIARWVAQGLVSGCEELRIGFVSKKENTVRPKFSILATIKETQQNLRKQLGISYQNLWGVFREVAMEILNSEQEGNFLVVKDPNNMCLLLFKMPDKQM